MAYCMDILPVAAGHSVTNKTYLSSHSLPQIAAKIIPILSASMHTLAQIVYPAALGHDNSSFL